MSRSWPTTAIKCAKRITSNNKADPFMGGEFAYEELGSGSQWNEFVFDPSRRAIYP
jgi:hypothetical protein